MWFRTQFSDISFSILPHHLHHACGSQTRISQGSRSVRVVWERGSWQDLRWSAWDWSWIIRCSLLCSAEHHARGGGHQEDELWWQAEPGEVAGHLKGDQVPHSLTTSQLYQVSRMLSEGADSMGESHYHHNNPINIDNSSFSWWWSIVSGRPQILLRFTRLRSEKMKYPEYVPVFSVVSTISTVNWGSTGRIRNYFWANCRKLYRQVNA